MPRMFTTQNDAYRRHARRLPFVAVFVGLLLSVAPGDTLASTTGAVPAFDHVFVIVMENRAYADVIGNTSQAPYINQLANQYGLADNYFAVTHPSLPNYLALLGGSTFGITTDCTTCYVNAANLAVDRVSKSGRSWKGYMESLPSPCFLGNSGLYVQKHNPFIYFDNIRTDPTQCANIVPFTQLGVDLASTATLPELVWITPNLCSDTHDCPISTGDTWLKTNVSAILNSPAYTAQNSLLLITWDEDDGGHGNKIPTIVVARSVPAGFRSSVPYTHYSLLKTIEDAWGLAPLTANDGNATAMADFFGSSAAADTTAPTQPGPITVSGITTTSASLKWGGSSDDVGIEGYRVYRGPAGAAQSALSLIATTDAVTSYSATHLYSGTGYTFGVIAIDAANNKSPMRSATLTTATSTDTTAPSVSTSISGRIFSSSRVDLVWAASTSTDVAGYNVYRDGAQIATVNLPNSPRYSDNGLPAASSHVYTVSTVDSAGNVSAATTGRTLKTLAAGALIVARGPYLSNVTGTSAVVSWWTNLPTAGVVSWGIATPTENSINDPAGTVQHHSVLINGLSPGRTHKYRVGNGAGLMREASFATAALPGQTFTFAAIGDFGGGGIGETQTANTIAGAGTAFVQTVGDNIYPTAGLPDPDFTSIYSDFDQRFYKPFAGVINRQSFFPANGNQEYYGDGAFWDNFPMPGANHSYYSYDWGDAHILVLDSEQPITTSSPQYQFAQSDLAAHQAGAWRIVVIQRPPYSSSSSNSSSSLVRTNLVPLFQQQHVSLVLSGNSHNYERTFPLTDGVPASGGITYVVTGAGGNGFNPFTLPQPAYSAFRQATFFEYTRVTVSPTSLVVDAIRTDTGAVFDTTAIQRSVPPPPVVVNQTDATAMAATASVSVTIPPTATGNTLVVVASLFTGTSKSLAAIHDSSGVTWSTAQKVASATSGSNGRVEIWWHENISGGLTSVTLSQPSGQIPIARWAIKVLELKGVAATAALDVAATTPNSAVSTLKTGLAGPVAAAGEFVLGAVATSGATSLTLAQASSTPTSGWVALADVGTGTTTTDVVGRTAYFGSTSAGGQYQSAWASSAARSGGGAVVVLRAGP